MPELPEVETICRQLMKRILNKKIKSVGIFYPKVVKGVSRQFFMRGIEGAKIFNVSRRAKFLLVHLSNKNTILFHLKMAGRLVLKNKKVKPEKFTEIVFELFGNENLVYDDLRRFGYMTIIKTADLEKFFKDKEIGQEPLEVGFTFKIFKELLVQKPRVKIKPLLMDQTFVAGVGNIYAQEACFCAGILPNRVVGTLKNAEIKKLLECLKKVLRSAIKFGGTSSDAYVDALGKRGKFVEHLKVYDRGGKKCFRCKNILKKEKLGGRGTVWCSGCQG